MKTVYKKLSLLFAATLLLFGILSFAACGHTHTPAEAVRENEVPATCTKGGSYDEVVYCSECSEEISRIQNFTEKKGHTKGEPTRENEENASCAKGGSYDEVVRCTDCESELSRRTVTVEKSAHTPKAAVRENEVAATCAKAGGYDEVVYCDVCGDEISRQAKTTEKAEHSYATTYSSDASGHWYKCGVCGDKKDFAAHTPGADATDTTAQKCTLCDYVIAGPIGHVHATSLTPVSAVAAGCTTGGNKAYYTCSCGKWFEDSAAAREIEDKDSVKTKATGHSYDTGWTSDDNYHWHKAVCEHTTLLSGKKLHSWDDGKIDGTTKTYTCTVCKATKTETVEVEEFVGARYLVKHDEGNTVTYRFEAECTNVGGKEGPGWSGTSKAMTIVAETASNGSVISYLYKQGMSVNFVIVCDRDVEDATLVLTLGAEFIDMRIDPSLYRIRVDPVNDLDLIPVEEGGAWGAWDKDFLNYYTGSNFKGYYIDSWDCGEVHIDADKSKQVVGIADFAITTTLRLKKGVNSISLITNNSVSDLGVSLGGTLEAVAPVVDAIKIKTSANLGLYEPKDNGYGAHNAAIE